MANQFAIQEGAKSFFLQGNKTLAILLHGFTASPYEMKDFAEYLHREKNYSIYVPLIAGHGRNEKFLNQTSYTEFVGPVEVFLNDSIEKYQHIILIGMSMGGSISLYLASKYKVDALICLATPIYLPKSTKALKMVLWFKYFINKRGGPDIADKVEAKKLISLKKIPLKALLEFREMLKKLVIPNLKEVRCPVILFHSKNDHTIDYKNMEKIRSSISSECIESHLLEKSFHILSLDVEKEKIFDFSLKFLNKLQL